jgi:YrbI family 3-deoxy-D-manno-octulosonate 8-phosphate phosphatase
MLIHCPAGIALMSRMPHISHGLQTLPQPGLNGRIGYQPRGRTLGGSSSTNAMVYIRGQQADYDRWAAMGNSGWSWQDVLPYFKKAEHNERLHDEWHGQGGPLNVADLQRPNVFTQRFVEAGVQAGLKRNADFNGASQEGVGVYQVTHRNGERFSAAKAYITPNLGRANLQVLTDVTAERIVLEEGVARQVQVIQGGVKRTLRARREIIVSGGTFQSPALLMRSGIVPVVITGRDSQALRRRISELSIQHAHYGVDNNLSMAENCLQSFAMNWSHVAAMGDDWPDLPVLFRSAIAFAPAQAHTELLSRVDHVCLAAAGGGAVREACDLLLNGRLMGETFGFSIVEPLMLGKPVIAPAIIRNPKMDKNHIEILGSDKYLYDNSNDLAEKVDKFRNGSFENFILLKLVEQFKPEVVIKTFYENFLSDAKVI